MYNVASTFGVSQMDTRFLLIVLIAASFQAWLKGTTSYPCAKSQSTKSGEIAEVGYFFDFAALLSARHPRHLARSEEYDVTLQCIAKILSIKH